MPRDKWLWVCGGVSLALYAGLLALSFGFRQADHEPPILWAVALLIVATLVYFLALGRVLRQREPAGPHSLSLIGGFALAYRLLLLFSQPILETDYYRYLWDGRVTLAGLNPYHYSPWEIDNARNIFTDPPAELLALDALHRQTPAVDAIFERVHYREVPTAYPPLAQLIFAAAVLLTPAAAPVEVQVLIWKLFVVAFDLATLALLVALLRRMGLPVTWCLAYAWCPLALKEFANSGHFDAIAIFCTTLTMYCLICLTVRAPRSALPAVAALGALALGVLAKSYPIVLLPVVLAYVAAKIGRLSMIALAAFVVVIVLGYAPFSGDGPPDVEGLHHPGTGLGIFLGQWEMNDFLFMLVRENLRAPPEQALPWEQTARWFVLVPHSWREALHRHWLIPWAAALDLSVGTNLANVLTQLIMGLVLLGLSLRWAWGIWRSGEPELLLRGAFLTLAWGWLLGAAQNPWYLLWCLPLMVFAGRRSWFLLTALALLYYVRFWVDYRDPSRKLEAFDYGVVWLEYLPFFAALLIECYVICRDRRERASLTPVTENQQLVAGD
jgi:hypothetical protein